MMMINNNNKNVSFVSCCEPGRRSRYSDSLRTGLSGDRFPAKARFSTPIQIGPGAHPTYGNRVYLPGVQRPGRGVDHPPSSNAEIKVSVDVHHY